MVIVIGGGAAGMLAAIAAAKAGNEVVLVEKNEKLGKKIYISGKGRCNLTNIADREEFFENIVSNARFMFSSFSQFNNYDIMAMMEETGVPVKVERGGRVFPKSDKSSDVIKALEKQMRKMNVEVRLKTEVQSILIEDNKILGVLTSRGEILADRVIVCTGGKSYPATGSTGDGYRFAKEAGHNVTQLSQGLCPIECNDSFIKELQGLALKNVSLNCFQNGKCLFSEQGEMLFTHFGISGPIVLTMSSILGKIDFTSLDMFIDLKPALDEIVLDKRLVRDFEESKNKLIKNAFDQLLPRSLIPVFIKRCINEIDGLEEQTQINSITKQQRTGIVKLLKRFTITPTSYRSFKEAIITKGGIDIGEINPKTMESKIVNGLYFAGEVLDLDGLTGGFNLQIAFTTGFCAGGLKI